MPRDRKPFPRYRLTAGPKARSLTENGVGADPLLPFPDSSFEVPRHKTSFGELSRLSGISAYLRAASPQLLRSDTLLEPAPRRSFGQGGKRVKRPADEPYVYRGEKLDGLTARGRQRSFKPTVACLAHR